MSYGSRVLATHDRVASGHAGESSEQPRGVTGVAEQTGVVAEHHDRVERPVGAAHTGSGEQADVTDSPLPGRADRAGRHIDGEDLVSSRLEVDRDATGTAPDIEHSPAYVLHRRTLV